VYVRRYVSVYVWYVCMYARMYVCVSMNVCMAAAGYV